MAHDAGVSGPYSIAGINLFSKSARSEAMANLKNTACTHVSNWWAAAHHPPKLPSADHGSSWDLAAHQPWHILQHASKLVLAKAV